MTTHEVVGGAVVLRTLAGSSQYLYRGAGFDASAFTEASVSHAAAVGLIREVEAAAAESEEKVELPSKDWNHDKINAWAAALDPAVTFDPAEKQTKEQKLEVLAPAIEAARAAAEQSNQ